MATNKILQAISALNGQKGTFYFTPDYGTYKGKQIELFDLVEFHLNGDTNTETRNVLNGEVEQEIDSTTKLSWTLTAYNVRSEFLEMWAEKLSSKVPIMGTVVVTNNGKQNELETQTVKLNGFTINSTQDLLQLNVNDHDLKVQMSGVVQGEKPIEIISKFKTPDVEWSEP